MIINLTPPPTTEHACVNSDLITQMRIDLTEIRNEQKHAAIMLQSVMSEIRSQRMELNQNLTNHDSRIRDIESNRVKWSDLDKISTTLDEVQTASDMRSGREQLTTIGIAAFISGIIAVFMKLFQGGN